MDSTTTTKTESECESTVQSGQSELSQISEKTLRYRRISLGPTPDDRLGHFKSTLVTEPPERTLKDTGDLQQLMRDFLQQAIDSPDESCYPAIDEFSFNLDREKSKLDHPIVNEHYFQADLKRCLAGNEATLQRTIMMHIIDQYWFDEKFDWNCEKQWSQPKDSHLPSTSDDEIPLPKPDLAISFTLQSFTQAAALSDPVPEELEETLSPNGHNQCFPFLFIEANKAGADIQDAYMKNLHTASQTLYNMYTWIIRSPEENLKEFFHIARVFSLVLDARYLSVRIHRVQQLEDGDLGYVYDEFRPLETYTRIQACQLIKTVLNDYAVKELHPLLKSAFIDVTNQEREMVRSKRKARLAQGGDLKRARTN